jgi:hypothetical protein
MIDWENILIVDNIEPLVSTGDFVRVKFGKYHNRKAQIIDIDHLSQMGSYRDRYSLEMCKSKEEFDCVREDFEKW